MIDIIISNAVFWPIWYYISKTPEIVMQSVIDYVVDNKAPNYLGARKKV